MTIKDTRSINPNPKKTVEYLSNPDFYQALKEYKVLCDASPGERPTPSNYIGGCIIKIAEGMARRPNFSGYTWKDEMIGDAIETCLKYIDRFDTDNYKNPHAYFSQIVWFSFLGRIALEKKQSKIKRELVRFVDIDTFTLQAHDETGEFTLNLQEFLQGLGDDASDVKEEKPKKNIVGPLEGFME